MNSWRDISEETFQRLTAIFSWTVTLLPVVIVAMCAAGCTPHVHFHVGNDSPELAQWRADISEQVDGLTEAFGDHLESHRTAEDGSE